jgi:hypothetical protein
MDKITFAEMETVSIDDVVMAIDAINITGQAQAAAIDAARKERAKK